MSRGPSLAMGTAMPHVCGGGTEVQGDGGGGSGLDSSPGSANHLLCGSEQGTHFHTGTQFSKHNVPGAHRTEVPPQTAELSGL